MASVVAGGATLAGVSSLRPDRKLVDWGNIRRRSVDGLTSGELLGLLARLRQARVGDVRVPHKPLLLLWLFGRFAATGSSLATYAEAEEPGD